MSNELLSDQFFESFGITRNQYDEAMKSMATVEFDIMKHNQNILKGVNTSDLSIFLDDCKVSDKMEWVDEPDFDSEKNVETYGSITLIHVDQWTLMEDIYAGYMYFKIKGFDKYLKVPYEV